MDMLVMGTDGANDEVKFERANNLMRRDFYAFSGWECFIGTDSINIRFDGTVYRGACKVGGPIGHISDPDLVLPTELGDLRQSPLRMSVRRAGDPVREPRGQAQVAGQGAGTQGANE